MAIGDEPPPHIDILDWNSLYAGTDIDDDAIIDGLALRGRWTAIAATAKAGKSTVILALTVAAARAGFVVIYIDAEMGRVDVLDRVANWMHLEPCDLTNIHYTDLPPKLDNVQGAQALWNTVEKLHPDMVVIDGLNGVVNGAENDDTTWRDMYEWAIAPLKARNIAVISLDNAGHGERKGPRGSSVKLDKADAILLLTRTDIGTKITATHRRTASYPLEQEYTVKDASEEGPAMKVARVDAGTGYPPETKKVCQLLDELGAPIDISRRSAQALLRAHDGSGRKAADLGRMLAWRKQQADFTLVPLVPGTSGNQGNQPDKWFPTPGNHSQETPACGVVPDGVSSSGHPPAEPQNAVPSEHEYEDPFG